MGRNSVVLGHPKSTGILRVERDPRIWGVSSKNFKNFKITLGLSLLACTNGYELELSIWTFIHGLELRPNPLLDQAKFHFGCKQLPPAYIVAQGPYCMC